MMVIKELLRHAIRVFDDRSGLAEHFVTPFRLSLVIQEQRLGHQHRGDFTMVAGTPGRFQGFLEFRDQLVARLPPGFTDLLQRVAGLPGIRGRPGRPDNRRCRLVRRDGMPGAGPRSGWNH